MAAKGGVDTGPSSFDIGGVILLIAGPYYLGSYFVYNITRSSTYDKPESLTLGKYDGFHLSVLPNRHGKIMPYLLFNKAF